MSSLRVRKLLSRIADKSLNSGTRALKDSRSNEFSKRVGQVVRNLAVLPVD
jgi:hypothetical protein